MGKMGIAALTAEFLTINFGSMAVFTILKEDKTKYWFNICYLLTLPLPAKVILNSEICGIFVEKSFPSAYLVYPICYLSKWMQWIENVTYELFMYTVFDI